MRNLSTTILTAAAASQASTWRELSELRNVTASVRVITSTTALAGTLTFRGTDFDAQIAAEPALSNTALLSALPTGFTHANGVITIASPAVGTFTINVTWPALPKWLLADWVYTSGDAGVTVAVALSGWS
jgi:hypothetical protein